MKGIGHNIFILLGSASIQAELAGDQQVQRFCGQQAMLGIFIDSGSEVDETDDGQQYVNNYGWTNILLRCPELEGND